jgi:CxxC motif-containing protein
MSESLTCITCPLGCLLDVEREEDGELRVSGNRCPRGAVYAREEFLSPRRTVTATCRLRLPSVTGAEALSTRRLPCRTRTAFPRERVGELLAAIYSLELSLPVQSGQILIKDALGLGIDVIATRSLDSLENDTKERNQAGGAGV